MLSLRGHCGFEETQDGEGEGGVSYHITTRDQHVAQSQTPQYSACQGECVYVCVGGGGYTRNSEER